MIRRGATSIILEEIKDKLEKDNVFGTFNVLSAIDLDDEKYPKLPFMALRVSERSETDLFTRSIRYATVDMIAVIHTQNTTHPNDRSLYGWDYATWLAESLTNFLNGIDFGNEVFVIERDVGTDVSDEKLGTDIVYMITGQLDMMFETIPL